MTPVSLNSISAPEPAGTAPSPARKTTAPDGGSDTVQLSPAALREAALTGRIAGQEKAGKLSSSQADQLYSQVQSIEQQIAAGGQSAAAITQLQNGLRQTIYTEANPGATPPTDPKTNPAGFRQAVEAGRKIIQNQSGGQ